LKTLDEMATYFGADRQISVSRELTKMFEETVRGTVTEVKTYFETHPLKGEFVMCVAGASPVEGDGKKKRKYSDEDED
jgi:16S rRNA (cytidine1402-2'-O)-methyltransferase